MREILPGVLTWRHASPEKKIDFNGWYVETSGEAVIVDPPPGTEELFEAIASRPAPKAIILTNKDHVRSSEEFARRYCVPILIHQADAPLADARIGGVFKHEEDLPAGLRALRVADAKSPGECALLLRRANAIIVGDALVGKPAGYVSMLPAEKFADHAKAREGVRALLAYPFDALLVGDGEPLAEGGRRALVAFLDGS